MSSENKQKGDMGEQIARMHLEKHGYHILETNYRTKTGEIDIIAEKDNIIVFVEVKYRANDKFGRPCEAVGDRKKRKIINTAKLYAQRISNDETCFRFDVIELSGAGFISLNHIENAFTL